jgi:hypothetical protein
LGAPSALSSAIDDALQRYGVKVQQIPVRPSTLRAMIRASGK